MKTLLSGQKNWNDPHKQEARRKTIIEPYRKIFSQSELPPTKQYWTLCGEMGTGKEISPGCELSQMVQEGFINPKQFHGIEGNPDIYKTNVNSLNKPYNKANLYHGEFTSVLDAALGSGELKPGLIYLDTIQEPKGAAVLLATTMDIINQTTGSVMLVWNFVQANKYRGRMFSWEAVKKELFSNSLYRTASRKWKQFGNDMVFVYDGTGRSSTTMGSIVYYRKC